MLSIACIASTSAFVVDLERGDDAHPLQRAARVRDVDARERLRDLVVDVVERRLVDDVLERDERPPEEAHERHQRASRSARATSRSKACTPSSTLA